MKRLNGQVWGSVEVGRGQVWGSVEVGREMKKKKMEKTTLAGAKARTRRAWSSMGKLVMGSRAYG